MMEDKNNLTFMIASAFFSGFAVGLNNKSNKKGKTFLQFVSEVLVHGVSGSIVGALSTIYVDDIIVICALAAIGGMFGQELLKVITNRFLKKFFTVPKEDNSKDEDCL